MTGDHTLAALCHPRSTWPSEIARWVTGGAAPVRILTCMSVDELTSVLGSGTAVTAVLLDGANNRVDAALVGQVLRGAATPIGVESRDRAVDWVSLGVTEVLSASFSRDDLMAVLDGLQHEPRPQRGPAEAHSVELTATSSRAQVIAVCGSNGAGASSAAMALATELCAGTPAHPHITHHKHVALRRTLLIDGASRSHQALYHHTGDVIPSIADLLAKVRHNDLGSGDLAKMTFPTASGYRVLLGAPTPDDHRSAPADAMGSLLRAVRVDRDLVVVDHDGECSTSPVSAALVEASDIWVMVTTTDMKGLADAAAMVVEAQAAGVTGERMLVVLNRTPRRGANGFVHRRELADLVERAGGDATATLVLPAVRLESALRDNTALPGAFRKPLGERVSSMLAEADQARARSGPRSASSVSPSAVAVGAP